MAKISTYPLEGNPKLSDKLIGTSVGLNQLGNLENPTYNFSLQQLLNLFSPLLPGNTLQGVLDNNNTATQDINLFGTITTEDLEVANIANIFSAYISDSLYIEGELFDKNNSQGTAGQILTSTGDGIEWITPSNVIPNLQQVLTSGNEADVDMTLTADITAEKIIANDFLAKDSFELNGTFLDSIGATGVSGQMLISLGTGVLWQDVPVYTASSPLFINPATKNITIQQANGTQNGYLSFADWITFNGKQNALSGTGIVISNGGTISYITDNSFNWNRAYNDSIVSAAVTGTTTKTLTLTQRDGDTITASWIDNGGGGGGISSIGLTMPAAFTVTNSPLTSNGVIAVTAAGTALEYIKGDGTLGTLPSVAGFVPYTGATQDVNLGLYDIYTAKLWLYDGPNDNYGSLHFTDGNFHIEDVDGHPLFVVEDGFLQIHKSATIQSNLFTTNLTETRDHYLPNNSGTIALTSDIHAPVTIGTANGLSLIGQQLSLGLSSSSANGALSSTDWTTFNNKFTLPVLTSGSVLFSNGTTIAQDNANLFWDNTNNRLVIGFDTPINNSRLLVVGDDYQITLASTNGLTGIFCTDQSAPMISFDNTNWYAFNNTIKYNVSGNYFNLKKITISDLGESTILGAQRLPNTASFATASEETLIGVYNNTTTYWETGIYAKRNIYCGAGGETDLLLIASPNSTVDCVIKIGYGDKYFIAKLSLIIDWTTQKYTYKIIYTNTTNFDNAAFVNDLNFTFDFPQIIGSTPLAIKLKNNTGDDIYANINANIL